jgi:hypothetical protein
MKLSKVWFVILLIIALTFSPVLDSLAQAGSINYKGINSVTVEDEYGMQQYRGLMFNFSFGGPKDYKRNNSLQEDVLKRDEKINKVGGYALLIVAVGTFIVIEANDD